MQMDENGKRHPYAFLSKTFTPAERNYEIYDRELLAIVRALEEWRHYLQGSPHTTTVYSDHKNLTYFRNPQRLNSRQARWSLLLSEYDLNLIHQPGSKMILSDALSRRPDHHPTEDENNEEQTLLPGKMFMQLIDLELQDKCARDGYKDLQGEASPDRTGGAPSIFADKNWKFEQIGNTDKFLTWYKGKLVVPDEDGMEPCQEIMKKYHNHPLAGHPGQLGMFLKISTHYWWPGMCTDIKNYVSGCVVCQQFKINCRPTKPALMPIEGSNSHRPFAQVSMDLITDLPESEGFDSILSVVDHSLTKGVILIPCKKTVMAEGIATLLINNLFKQFGLPEKVISN